MLNTGKTEDNVNREIDFLPLKSYANIVEGNALRIDWESVVPKHKLNYIMGNPPFVGKKEQTKEQKAEMMALFDKTAKGVGNLDYVSGWYVKAVKYIADTSVFCAFVSTNSITQGEQVPILWKNLIDLGVKINFAHRTFKWNSEATEKAAVHCVIIGFAYVNKKPKTLFTDERYINVNNINPYLIDAPTVLIENRSKSISNAPNIMYGSMPIDDGHLILSADDLDLLLAENNANIKFVKKYLGGAELLRNTDRWCLWLKNVSPKDIQQSKFIIERIKCVKEFRESSKRPQTKVLADTPTLFGEIRQPESNMLVITKVSSENRKYIPIGFVSPEIIVNGSALIIPDATLYHLGVLSSNIHNAWVRLVAGRMKSDYQYSGTIVYNNFPWCNPTEEQKARIEKTAQAILDARALYPDCSLADLYDELTMPPELRKAHQENDRAVMQAYGFDVKTTTESSCVAELMKMYQMIING